MWCDIILIDLFKLLFKYILSLVFCKNWCSYNILLSVRGWIIESANGLMLILRYGPSSCIFSLLEFKYFLISLLSFSIDMELCCAGMKLYGTHFF